jgi:hypothetical protein
LYNNKNEYHRLSTVRAAAAQVTATRADCCSIDCLVSLLSFVSFLDHFGKDNGDEKPLFIAVPGEHGHALQTRLPFCPSFVYSASG